MSKFAIVRQDGEVDVADGDSVQQVADAYGWPGNGNIEPLGPQHTAALRHQFTSPQHQRDLLNAPVKKEKN